MDHRADGMKGDQLWAWRFVTIGLAEINRRRASMPADDCIARRFALA